ncbi:hypothetical protein ASPCAL04574 [Aspergillus calidoustus]|uniref:Mid2 domain-containing protein n=1 Tax=Aspergillus calidoustus TaxID=454130 RepID=A0A0U5FVC0_ASPCI|nr:hypothetical protein ASPCAL04574 [Aspergillus calidoustus]
MLPIISIWISILITIQGVFAVAFGNPDLDPIARSNTHTSIKLSRDENYFTSPGSANPDSDSDSATLYEVGDVVEVSWITTLDVFNVTLWQRDLSRGGNGTSGVRSGGNIFSKTSSTSTLSNISWIVQTYALDLEKPSTFFLSIDAYTDAVASSNSNSNSKLDYEDWPSTGFVSGMFNISSSSTTASTQPNTETNTGTSEETSTDQRSETTNTPETSLTSTGKIALGLGAGIGAPLISLLAILAYFQVRSARRKYASSQHAQQQHHQHHPSIPPPPEMSLSMPGLAHHAHPHQGMGLGLYPPPFSVSPNSNPGQGLAEQIPSRNPVPSELSQKVAKPVVLPPWEVDAAPESTSPTSAPDPNSGMGIGNTNGVTRANTTITVIPRPNARPRPAARGLGIERERGRRGPGLGEGTGPGKRSMWSTRRVGQPDNTTSTGGRQSTITIGLPELPGENYI